MSSTENKYPFFDLSEIIPDQDLSFNKYQPLKPLVEGNFVHELSFEPEYSRWKRFYNGAETHGPIKLNQYFGKPLVISFYSKNWQHFGIEQLNHLNAIQYEIKANGGNVLIISAERDNDIAKIAWQNSLSLSFYDDDNNELAEKFRIYSETDPVWNKFSGIDVNVPLLATFVIDTTKQIVYDHINLNFLRPISSKDIISAVYKAALINNKQSA